jgi:serine/tyrosine/threonine adenylyltransferase
MNLSHSYQTLPDTFYKVVSPSAFKEPFTVIYNHALASELGLQLTKLQIKEWLSGLYLPPFAKPIAQAYAGHQFGHFNMLGDGRAILLGEIKNAQNELFDLQLKGAGPTEYSRRGDGKCALSSALREYIYSECMHALGIDSTRSLAVVGTGDTIYRQELEQGAVLTRIAKSHIRFGTFEYAAHYGTIQDLEALVNYTLQRHFPNMQNKKNKAIALLQSVIEKQMKLIVQWMRVGFIHGVLNTDNMSISGQTIDFGPCAFMNAYDANTVYSQIDTNGRYAFGKQAAMAHWNLVRFAETLLPLIHIEQREAITMATDILESANSIFALEYNAMMHAKIGIAKPTQDNMPFIENLFSWMQKNKADYTNTFLHLMNKKDLQDELYNTTEWKNLVHDWEQILLQNQVSKEEALILMQKNNPNYIPRNNHVDVLINNCVNSGSIDELEKFLQQMQSTYNVEIAAIGLCTFKEDSSFSTHCNT